MTGAGAPTRPVRGWWGWRTGWPRAMAGSGWRPPRSRHNGDRSSSWLGDLAPGSPGPSNGCGSLISPRCSWKSVKLSWSPARAQVIRWVTGGPQWSPWMVAGGTADGARLPLDVADEVDGPARAPEITGLDDHIESIPESPQLTPAPSTERAQLERSAADPGVQVPDAAKSTPAAAPGRG